MFHNQCRKKTKSSRENQQEHMDELYHLLLKAVIMHGAQKNDDETEEDKSKRQPKARRENQSVTDELYHVPNTASHLSERSNAM